MEGQTTATGALAGHCGSTSRSLPGKCAAFPVTHVSLSLKKIVFLFSSRALSLPNDMYDEIEPATIDTVAESMAKLLHSAFGMQFFTPYMHALLRHGREIRRRNGDTLAGKNAAWQFESTYGKVAKLFETSSRNTTKAALTNHLLSFLDSHHDLEGCRPHAVIVAGPPKPGSRSRDNYFFTFDPEKWSYRCVFWVFMKTEPI